MTFENNSIKKQTLAEVYAGLGLTTAQDVKNACGITVDETVGVASCSSCSDDDCFNGRCFVTIGDECTLVRDSSGQYGCDYRAGQGVFRCEGPNLGPGGTCVRAGSDSDNCTSALAG